MKTITINHSVRKLAILLMGLLLALPALAVNTFVTTGGTVVTGYWNATNTGGTANFIVPNPDDAAITYCELTLDENDAESFTVIGSGGAFVSEQQNVTLIRTAAEIEAAGAFADGNSFDVYVVFKNNGNVAVDTLVLATNIIIDQTAPLDFTVGAITVSGGNIVGGYWNSSNTGLAVSVPIGAGQGLSMGTLQISGFVGANDPEDLGNEATILVVGGNQTVNLVSTDFVNKVWFLDDQTFSLNATITDLAGNATVGTASATTFHIDMTAPSISAVTSSTADGTYGVDDEIDVTITFDEAVTLSGGNLLTNLNSGAQLSTNTINDVNTLSQTYTIASGQASTDLAVSSLSLSSGSARLKDEAGNNADLETIVSNMDATSDIEVDGSTPTILSITSTTAEASYGVGDAINITITFSEPVTLAGGNLLLDIDASTTNVVILPFGPASSISVNYTVGNGDASSALDVETLSLSGGSLIDAGGNSVNLSLVGVANIDDVKTIQIDGASPEAFTVGAVVTTGGTVVVDYWNGTNENIMITVPIANDPSLVGGEVQVQGFYGAIGGATDIGSPVSIVLSDLSSTVSVTVSEAQILTGMGSMNDGATLKITAKLSDAGGNATTGTQSTDEFIIDQTAPVVSEISSSSADGTYGIGQTVNVTIDFSENVTITNGSLVATLNSGTTISTSDITGISSVSQTYTVAEGHQAADLSVTLLARSGGTARLKDAAGNAAVLDLPASNMGTTSDIVIDGIYPQVTSIIADAGVADGSYGVGAEIDLEINFDETVTLSGGNLMLNIDASTTDVTFLPFASANQATATYTVGNGDSSDDLTATGLSLSAGTLVDAGGNAVDLSDISGVTNIDDGSDIAIDGAAPAAFTVGSVVATGGNVVVGYWNFSNTGMNVTVPVANDPTLTDGKLIIKGFFGDVSGAQVLGDTITIVLGDLGSTVTESYTAGQVEALAPFSENTTLKITAELIDAGGNATTATESGNVFLIDQTQPTLLEISSTTTDGTYGIDDVVNVTIDFSEVVTLSNGSLITTLNSGASLSIATVPGVSTLSQNYTIAELEEADVFSVSSVTLSGGTTRLYDAAGNTTNLTLPASNIANTSAIEIDGVYPEVESITTTKADGSYGISSIIDLTVTFSEPVTLAGGNLLLDIDASATNVTRTPFSNSATALANYTVAATDASSDLTVTTLSLSGIATLVDAGGNEVDLSDISGITNVDDGSDIVIDGVAPLVPSPSISAVTATGGNVVADYWNGSNTGVRFTVPIPSDVTLQNGSVQIQARVGSNNYANLGSSSTILIVDANKLVNISKSDVLAINGYDEGVFIDFRAVLTDNVSNSSIGDAAVTSLEVDTEAPEFSSATSVPVTDRLAIGETANITINFSESITLAGGTLITTLEAGSTDPTLTTSAFASQTSITETYTVSAGETSSDLDLVSMVLSGATLRDLAGNSFSDTTFTAPTLAGNSALIVDGTIPSITSITGLNGNYAEGDVVTLTVTFSEASTLSGGNLLITLETGTDDRIVTIGSFSNSLTATGNYTVQAGDETPALSVNAFNLSAGTLQDLAGNDMDLTVPASGNLDDNNTLVIDGSVPNDFTVGAVVTAGGVVSAGYWNGGNTSVLVTVPIENDPSLQNGNVQVQARVGSNAYANIGSASTILSVPNPTKQITLAEANIEAIAGYEEGAVLSFRAIMEDFVGNATIGTASATTLTVDTQSPSISSISSDPVSDNLSVDESATITINFDEAVTLAGGTLVTTLETGTTDAQLTTTPFVSLESIEQVYTVSEGESSADLTVNQIELILGSVRDDAGNNISTLGSMLTLPGSSNLGDNSNLVVDGGAPVISSISSTVAGASLGLGGTMNFDIDFSESVTLTGGNIVVTLETGTVDQQVLIGPFTASASASGSYTVQVGDVSSDLTVASISLSAGTLKDAAGNDVDLSLPAGENLADNNSYIVDGVVPIAFATGDMVTLGAPVVADYWNLGNDTIEVIVPVDASDASLLGGSVRLEMQINANGYAQIGSATTISVLNPVTMITTRAQLEAGLSGYFGGGTIYARAIITDVVGNQTTGTASSNALVIDQGAPTATVTQGIVVIGGTAVQGYWNPTNTNLTVSTPVGNDATLVGGSMQLEMKIGGGGFSSVGSPVAIGSVNSTIPITIGDQASFDAADGLAVVFRAVTTDIAGNATTGTQGTPSITIDVTAPTGAQVGSVVATSGNVVQNYFNSKNRGGQVTIPIDDDETLLGGTAQLLARIDGVYTNLDDAVDIVDNEDITFVFTEVTMQAQLSYADGDTIFFKALVTDVAGNGTTFSASSQYFIIDETSPDSYVSEDIRPLGGTVVDGYWNASNTALLIKVPLSDDGSPDDGSLIGGSLSVSADLIEPDDGSYEFLPSTTTILSLGNDTVSVTIPAAELEALEGGTGFTDGLTILFRTTITDIAGNTGTSVTSAETFVIDQSVPTAPSVTDLVIIGDNAVDGFWSATADSLLIAVPVTDPDPSLNGGFLQVYMSAAASFADNSELVVSDEFPITGSEARDTLRIAAADIATLSGFNDGLNLYTQILVQDRAGNRVLGSVDDEVILVDITAPNPFTSGALEALDGDTVVVQGYNNSNDGISLTIPINNDLTLENGTAILWVAINAGTLPPFESYEEVGSVTIPDPVGIDSLSLTLDHAQLSALTGFQHGASIYAKAELIDIGGNRTMGGVSNDVVLVDLIGPTVPVATDTSTVGGIVSTSYWNSSNTGISVTVPTPALSDNSLVGGHFQIRGRVGFEVTYEDLGSPVAITSVNFPTGTASIAATDLEGLFGFTDGLPIDLLIYMEDGYGNDTLSAAIDDWRIIDQGLPSLGNFVTTGTTSDPFIKAGYLLEAEWQGFTDAVSGVASYEYAIGSTAGANDLLDWVALTETSYETTLTYVHGQSYYLNVRALDAASNVSEVLSTDPIIADLIAPQSTIDMDQYYFIDLWPGSVTGTYADGLSGVDSLLLDISRSSDGFYWDGSDWVTDSTIIELDLNAGNWSFDLDADELENRVDYRVHLMAVDSARNRQVVASFDSFQFVINTAPVMRALADTSSLEDSEFSRYVRADDVDLGTVSGDTLYYFLRQGPDSMVIDTLTGLLTWTPDDADVGNHLIQVLVQDAMGEADSTSFTLTVLEVNDPPEPVTLLLPADSTQLVAADGLDLTFVWTAAFDIESNPVSYRLIIRNAGYDTLLSTTDTSMTVDVSVMDFPVEMLYWHVLALDAEDTSAVADSFRVTTSPAFAELNTLSIDVDLDRYSSLDTLFTMGNLGLTDLRWSVEEAPTWITLVTESGIIHFEESEDIAFSMDLSGFTIGSYGGTIRMVTNDPLQDTISVAVNLVIYDTPTPVLAFYKNPAYPAIYELMIVDSLGMIDTLIVTLQGDTLETREVSPGSYSYLASIEVASEGTKRFVVYASNWTGDTTLTRDITVSLARSSSAWMARSPDDLFEMRGNAGSALGKAHVTVLDTLLSALDEARYKVLSDGLELAEPVLVSMPATRGDQAIYRQDESGDYYELASVSTGSRVSAWADQMGAFKLGPRTLIVPELSRLAQNYPNPFNPSTTIEFDIGFQDGLIQDVIFGIYNIRGQEVKQLMHSQLQPGSYAVTWNGLDDSGRQVSSGIYFARMLTGKGYIKTVKMLVLR